jgi:hypothetical protein
MVDVGRDFILPPCRLLGETCGSFTDKKENEIFLIYKEIQGKSGAQSNIRKGFLIYKEMRKY